MPFSHRLLLAGVHAQTWVRRHGAGGPGGGDDEPMDDETFVTLLLLAAFLVSMAGLMSGLTLGLMSLDHVDIEILLRSGTARQKALAARIQPLLRRPHVLLVTLLVCNAAAAEALPLVLDRLADPVTAVLVSVTVVLLFGEIIPQAACKSYGLQIGAYSAPFVRALILVTAPVSLPIGWVLDRVLGARHTALFRRAELKALVDIHTEGQPFGGQLSADEVSVIKGALDLTHKRARDAMTPLDMVFMLPADARLDAATLTAVMASGHSRIPVHAPGDRRAILGIMLVKELLLVDPGAGASVGRQKVRSLPFVRADTPLYDMLKLFEIGRSHMAVLMQVKRGAAERLKRQTEEELMLAVDSMSDDPSLSDSGDEGELSPRRTAQPEDFLFDPADFEPVGVITIEDVLEELLQAEILDETDQFVDNLRRTPINAGLLMRSLPPHLRGVLGARALLPRIGGAGFMGGAQPRPPSHLARPPSAADHDAAAADDRLAAAAAAVAAAVAAEPAGATEGGARLSSPTRPAGLPPRSPRGAAPASGVVSPLPPGRRGGGGARPRSARGSASGAGSAGGSAHGGLLFKQGAVGAALVAEALRQEVAQQLAAEAAAAEDGEPPTPPARRPRSRSRSPLPGGVGGRRANRASADGAAMEAGLAGPPAEPLPPLFPGLPRTRSDAAEGGPPRVVVPLPPPPTRRSTHVSQRVQEQMDLLEPLLLQRRTSSGRLSLEEERRHSGGAA